MNKEITIELTFYFTFDGLIIFDSPAYLDVFDKAIEYYNKYGEGHNYNIYIVNKYNFKEMVKKSDN